MQYVSHIFVKLYLTLTLQPFPSNCENGQIILSEISWVLSPFFNSPSTSALKLLNTSPLPNISYWICIFLYFCKYFSNYSIQWHLCLMHNISVVGWFSLHFNRIWGLQMQSFDILLLKFMILFSKSEKVTLKSIPPTLIFKVFILLLHKSFLLSAVLKSELSQSYHNHF